MSRPLAVRSARGALHIGVRRGRVFETACFRTITQRAAADGAVYEGRDRWGRRRQAVAWRHERRCRDCEHLASFGDLHVLRVLGLAQGTGAR